MHFELSNVLLAFKLAVADEAFEIGVGGVVEFKLCAGRKCDLHLPGARQLTYLSAVFFPTEFNVLDSLVSTFNWLAC
jgi:hypothetical protein